MLYKSLKFCLSLVAFANLTSAFNNPVIKGKDSPDPGAILWNNEYYVVTTSGPAEGKFAIHKSSDL